MPAGSSASKTAMSEDAPRASDSRAGGIQSVGLALDILEALAGSERDMGVTQLAAALDTSKARVYRHLQTLRERGYVEQGASGEKYRLGVAAFLLSRAASKKADLLVVSRPEMEFLRDRLGHTVVVSTVIRDEIVILDLVRGRMPVEIGLRLGSSFALHATAQGLVALAFGPPELMDRVLARELEKITPKTAVHPDSLIAQVETVRAQGWATAAEKTIVGINALAVPIFGENGVLAGQIAIVGSIQYIAPTPAPEQIDAVTGAGLRISRRLGYGGRTER